MAHNLRCASAKSPQCRCSCGGSLHSGDSLDGRRRQESRSLSSSTIKSVAIGAGIGAAATIFPATIPIYKAYKIAEIGKKLYDAYCKSKNKERVFDKLMSESAKYGTSEASERITENKASQVAKSVRLVAESAGLISQISKETKIDEDIYGSMLEGSVKNGMLSGIGNFTSYTVEEFMG
jgi:hypothetical protein